MSDKSPYQEKANESKAHVVWHESNISKADRAKVKDQKPKCIWLTGLSGSGKSTLANALEVALTLGGEYDTWKIECRDKNNKRTYYISPELGHPVAFKRKHSNDRRRSYTSVFLRDG